LDSPTPVREFSTTREWIEKFLKRSAFDLFDPDLPENLSGSQAKVNKLALITP
jgi:hypothetical protein